MKNKILYLVETTTGDKWEHVGGNYLVKAFSKKEAEKMFTSDKMYPEKITDITPVSKLSFKKGICVINESVVE